MSLRTWPQRIADILEAIAEIRRFVAGVSFEEFAANAEKLKAVLADFAIIGEAARHIPAEVQEKHTGVAWRQMRDMRNVIVHVYFAVNPQIVWDTIQKDLPMLEQQLRAVLATQPEPDVDDLASETKVAE